MMRQRRSCSAREASPAGARGVRRAEDVVRSAIQARRRLSRKLASIMRAIARGLQAQSALAVAASALVRAAVRHYTQGFLAVVPLMHGRGGPPNGGCRSG